MDHFSLSNLGQHRTTCESDKTACNLTWTKWKYASNCKTYPAERLPGTAVRIYIKYVKKFEKNSDKQEFILNKMITCFNDEDGVRIGN
jgi:hypothetical protein